MIMESSTSYRIRGKLKALCLSIVTTLLLVFTANSQILHSATDSVVVTNTNTVTDWGRGFRFEPTQDIYVIEMGKRVPSSGTYSWVIWDVSTQTKVYQQNSLLNNPTNYVYEAVPRYLPPIKLDANTEYVLELYTDGTADYYYGPSTQIGQHLTLYNMQYCNNCDTNTYPATSLTGQHYGTPDFLYSLTPPQSGPNDATVMSVDSPGVFCGGSQNVVVSIGNY